MSYCRWSTDNYHCDLYCYESSEGYQTHVAGNRVRGIIPDNGWEAFFHDKTIDAEECSRRTEEQHNFLMSCVREQIPLPYAGESFLDNTLREFRARLVLLRHCGYNFPDGVLADVDAEIAEMLTSAKH